MSRLEVKHRSEEEAKWLSCSGKKGKTPARRRIDKEWGHEVRCECHYVNILVILSVLFFFFQIPLGKKAFDLPPSINAVKNC